MGIGYGGWLALRAASLNPNLYQGIIADAAPTNIDKYQSYIGDVYGKMSSQALEFSHLTDDGRVHASIDPHKLQNSNVLFLGHDLNPLVRLAELDTFSQQIPIETHTPISLEGEDHELCNPKNRKSYLQLVAAFLGTPLNAPVSHFSGYKGETKMCT
jgi:pimeloyl-ACP methyl ester carboxylesterase